MNASVIDDECDRLADYVVSRLDEGVEPDEMAAALSVFRFVLASEQTPEVLH